jgi:nucleoside-diphosphate-sugar epimerase
MNVFVTGATGFLGTKLVKRLVEETHDVYILARSAQKVSKLLQHIDEEKHSFIHVIEGDLSKENLGIEDHDLNPLIGKMDVIYHTAAYLSFDESMREEIFRINVSGTRHVLQVAEKLQTKKFIHVSTAYTLGARTEGKEELYPLDSTFINSYEESKCHAEHLVMSYQDKFDVSIMRPAIIIGDSETGEADTTFGLYGIMRTIELLKRKHSKNPDDKQLYRLLIEKDMDSNLVPVDYVVDILALGLHFAKKNTVYHITNPHSPKNEIMFNVIKDAFGIESIFLLPYKNEDQLTLAEANFNKPLKVFKEYLNRSIHFSNENTNALLSQGKKPQLNMDEAMIYRIVNGFINRRYIAKEKVLKTIPSN